MNIMHHILVGNVMYINRYWFHVNFSTFVSILDLLTAWIVHFIVIKTYVMC